MPTPSQSTLFPYTTLFRSNRRKGAVLVEYALLIAGVALVCALSVAVLGHKTFMVYGIMADIIPRATAHDNQLNPLTQTIRLHTKDGPIQLDANALVSSKNG